MTLFANKVTFWGPGARSWTYESCGDASQPIREHQNGKQFALHALLLQGKDMSGLDLEHCGGRLALSGHYVGRRETTGPLGLRCSLGEGLEKGWELHSHLQRSHKTPESQLNHLISSKDHKVPAVTLKWCGPEHTGNERSQSWDPGERLGQTRRWRQSVFIGKMRGRTMAAMDPSCSRGLRFFTEEYTSHGIGTW